MKKMNLRMMSTKILLTIQVIINDTLNKKYINIFIIFLYMLINCSYFLIFNFIY